MPVGNDMLITQGEIRIPCIICKPPVGKQRGKFDNPQYLAQRSSQIRQDSNVRNRLLSESLTSALEEAGYMATNLKPRANIEGCPCQVLGKHVRGSYYGWAKWQNGHNELTILVKRQMDRRALLRDHLTQAMETLSRLVGRIIHI